MDTDLKNRFNEINPFEVVRAEDFGSDLYEFYEPLEKLIREVSGVDIEGSRPVFLIGGRGTGKTMVLKFLSLEMQLKHYIANTLEKNCTAEELNKEEISEFLAKKDFISIYLHLKTNEFSPFKKDIGPLFRTHLSLKISELVIRNLVIFKNIGLISPEKENTLSQFFLNQIKEPKPNVENKFENILDFISEDVYPIISLIIEKYSYYTFDEIKEEINIPLIFSEKIIFEFPDLIFSELEFLRGKNLFIILDELEYLNNQQNKYVGQLIKDSDGTSVIFKIGSRYMPKEIPVGETNETLQDLHDFRVINITDALNAAHSGWNNEYTPLIKKILNKRIEKSNYYKKYGITNVDQLFPNISLEDEACELVKGREKHWRKFKTFLKQTNTDDEIDKIIDCLRYQENPIIEKLNMLLYYRNKSPEEIKKMLEEFLIRKNEKYTLLYQKNALNLLFQLYNDYSTEKKYVGIDVFIFLSSGIIRSAIEVCNLAIRTANNYAYDPSEEIAIENIYQDIGVKQHAEIKFKEIEEIPQNLGLSTQHFIKELGTIFRALHLNRYLVEPEPTHFETIYSELKGQAKIVFDTALNYSYIQKKPSMNPKNANDLKNDDYIINRGYAPYFQISYRVRGRTYISPSQIQELIEGNNKDKTRKEVIRLNSKREKIDGNQKTLLNTDELVD